MKEGDIVRIDGYADELGIEDYGRVRVITHGVIEVTPLKYSKKVLVTLDCIDGEGGVTVRVFKNKLRKL